MKKNQIDETFNKIITEMGALIKSTAAKNSEQVLAISGEFLSSKSHQAIQDFYELYFSTNSEIESSKETMNQQVDDIFEAAQAAVASGSNVQETVSESDETLQTRLRLSAVQKDLEALITMEEGLRDKLMPVLSNVQFEDSLRQRIDHIVQGWDATIAAVQSGQEGALDQAIDKIKGLTSSIEETEAFYRLVLNEEPPQSDGDADSGMFLF